MKIYYITIALSLVLVIGGIIFGNIIVDETKLMYYINTYLTGFFLGYSLTMLLVPPENTLKPNSLYKSNMEKLHNITTVLAILFTMMSLILSYKNYFNKIICIDHILASVVVLLGFNVGMGILNVGLKKYPVKTINLEDHLLNE